jgi:cation/acetate symporter
MKGITYTSSTVLRVNICFHGSCYLYFYQMTGNPVPQLGMEGRFWGDTYLLDKLNGLHGSWIFSIHERYEINGRRLCNYTPLMVGTAGLPHVIVRFHG